MIGSLQRNTLWLTVATVTYTGCQWLTIVFLSRFTSASTLGYYTLAVALVMPLIAFTNLQLRYLLCSDIRGEFSFGSYFSARVVTAFIAIVGASVWAVFYRPAIFFVVLALAISRAGDALSDIVYGVLQARGRIDRIALSLMLQGPLQLVVFALALWLTQKLLLGVLVAAAVSFAVFLFFDLRSLRLVLPRQAELWSDVGRAMRARPAEWQKIRSLIWLGVPMGIVMGLNSLIGNVPRYFLASDQGEALVGIFSALFYLTLPGGIVVTALCDSSIAQIAAWAAAGDLSRVWKMVGYLTVAAGLVGFAGWFVAYEFGDWVLSVCYGPQYAIHTAPLNWLMGSAGFMYISTVLGSAVTALREFRLQVQFRVVHLGFICAICFYWIPAEALLGASKSMFASSVFFALAMAVLLLIVVRKRSHRLPAEGLVSCSPAESGVVTDISLN